MHHGLADLLTMSVVAVVDELPMDNPDETVHWADRAPSRLTMRLSPDQRSCPAEVLVSYSHTRTSR